jgi:hypothetical protein
MISVLYTDLLRRSLLINKQSTADSRSARSEMHDRHIGSNMGCFQQQLGKRGGISVKITSYSYFYIAPIVRNLCLNFDFHIWCEPYISVERIVTCQSHKYYFNFSKVFYNLISELYKHYDFCFHWNFQGTDRRASEPSQSWLRIVQCSSKQSANIY